MAHILLTPDQQHTCCMTATRHAFATLSENGRTVCIRVPVLTYMNPVLGASIFLTVDYDVVPFKAWATVHNDFTSRTYEDRHGTDDPLVLYANLRAGLTENLRSIAWKLDEPRRAQVLDYLTATAVGNIKQE
jgi:hypothetical protein